MPSSGKQSASRWTISDMDARRRQVWLDAISISDWIMKLPEDANYISPFQMQGCLYE